MATKIAIESGLLINGEWVEGHDVPLDIVNPATGARLAKVQCANAQDVDRAVKSARLAFEDGVWSRMPIHSRALVLQRFATTIEDNLGDLYQLETSNNGRPLAETRAQISRLPEWYRYNAALLLADRTSVVPMVGPYHSYLQRFPLAWPGYCRRSTTLS